MGYPVEGLGWDGYLDSRDHIQGQGLSSSDRDGVSLTCLVCVKAADGAGSCWGTRGTWGLHARFGMPDRAKPKGARVPNPVGIGPVAFFER